MRKRHPLNQVDGETLLRLARHALEAYVRAGSLPTIDLVNLSPCLQASGASFVTLTRCGQIRGCVGSLEAARPLAQDVCQRAVDAASRDYRFQPVSVDELQEIRIEISVLSPPKPLRYAEPEEIPSLLNPGEDGVILTSGLCRATFLPQVWERAPTPEEFLGLLCRKAGLASDVWQRGQVKLQTYQVEHFYEREEPLSGV
jgi:AmmeMemoRadiSam system protein A